MNTDRHRLKLLDVTPLSVQVIGLAVRVKRFLAALGMTKTKGFEEAVRLYEVRWRDDA